MRSWIGFPHFRSGTIDVREKRTISIFDSFLCGLSLSAFRPIFYFQDEPPCPPHRLIVIYHPGCGYLSLFNGLSLSRIGGLCDFEGVLNCCFSFYIFCRIYPPFPICMSQSRSWGFIEALRRRTMGLNDQPLFLLLPELLCQPYHLVGITQASVYLSCFTGCFSPGLFSVLFLEGWLTVVLASTSPFIRGPIPFREFIDSLFTVLVRRFVVKKMHY